MCQETWKMLKEWLWRKQLYEKSVPWELSQVTHTSLNCMNTLSRVLISSWFLSCKFWILSFLEITMNLTFWSYFFLQMQKRRIVWLLNQSCRPLGKEDQVSNASSWFPHQTREIVSCDEMKWRFSFWYKSLSAHMIHWLHQAFTWFMTLVFGFFIRRLQAKHLWTWTLDQEIVMNEKQMIEREVRKQRMTRVG